jgi:hypothetical protein
MTICTAFRILALSASAPLGPSSYAKNPASLPVVAAAVEEVNDLRTALVHALPPGGKVDDATFAQVCKPVGARAQALGKEHGWTFIQMSDRYRNPKHKADVEAESALKAFRSDETLQSFWTKSKSGDKIQHRYFRRIVVDQPCLACHGDKDARPAFIKSKYPDDRAFGFGAGDLRGVYSVTWTE